MAPLVSPRMGGKVITRQGFRTNQFTTPKIAPERPMDNRRHYTARDR